MFSKERIPGKISQFVLFRAMLVTYKNATGYKLHVTLVLSNDVPIPGN